MADETKPPKLVIPEKWPEYYKKDFIANRTHGVDNLRDNEMVVKGKVVAKPYEPKKVTRSDCPVCKGKNTFVMEPVINANHCGQCGYWDEDKVKAYFNKVGKKKEDAK